MTKLTENWIREMPLGLGTRQEIRDRFDELKRKHGVNSVAGTVRTMRTVINAARRIDEAMGFPADWRARQLGI